MTKAGVLDKDFTITHPDPLDPESGFQIEAHGHLLNYYAMSSERTKLLRSYRTFEAPSSLTLFLDAIKN